MSQDVAVPAAEIDALFEGYGDTTPGAAVIVVRDGRVLFRGGYGMVDLEHGIGIGPSTVFDIASVSKQFTGFAIATLVEDGTVDLDADIREYIPEAPDFGTPVTVRHPVHHTSGIRDWPATLALAGWRMDDVIAMGLPCATEADKTARGRQNLGGPRPSWMVACKGGAWTLTSPARRCLSSPRGT